VKENVDNYDLVDGNQLNLLLCEVPETLDWPCSATFAGSLVCTQENIEGISISANDITIDMAGHALIGPGTNSSYGIYQNSTYRNLHISNGKIVGWNRSGITGIYAYGQGSILTDLQVMTNYYGIYAGPDSVVSRCVASYNGDNGIFIGNNSRISDCTASYNGNHGIYGGGDSVVSRCTASYNSNDGIHAHLGNTTISGCTACNNSNNGIYAIYRCTVSGCTANENTGDGIYVYQSSMVTGCSCDMNGNGGDGAGIHADGYASNNNRIENNNVVGNDYGIKVNNSGNFIVRNTASDNGTNYSISGTQTIGPIITATGTITSENPWANFSF